MSHGQKAGRGRGWWVARTIGSCSVSPSVELLESKVSCIRRLGPVKNSLKRWMNTICCSSSSPDWPSSLLGVGGVGNADGQYTPRMKFLCVSFYYGFDSSTACLCSLVIFDRSFLSFTPNQELGYSVYKRYRPIYVFVWFTALSMRIARSIQVAANSILLFFFLMTE